MILERWTFWGGCWFGDCEVYIGGVEPPSRISHHASAATKPMWSRNLPMSFGLGRGRPGREANIWNTRQRTCT